MAPKTTSFRGNVWPTGRALCEGIQSKDNSLPACGDIRASKASVQTGKRNTGWQRCHCGQQHPMEVSSQKQLSEQYPIGSKCWTAQQRARWRGRGQSRGIPGMSQTFIQCACDSNWNREMKRMKECLMTDPEGP